jgi:hypothetical protein
MREEDTDGIGDAVGGSEGSHGDSDSAQNTASSATETCKPLCSDDSKAFVYGTEGIAVL